ncbi:hypothetical protein ACN3XK_22560 [Actinomadura welshii]
MLFPTAPLPRVRTSITTVTATALTAAAAAAAVALAPPASAAERGRFAPVQLPFFWPANDLCDVAAASPGSVWISGHQGELVVPGPIPGTGRLIPGNPVVRRWTGERWVEYDLQGLPNRGSITDVDAAAPEDVWIAGLKYGEDNATTTYLAHFTGSRFTQVPLPAGASHARLQAGAAGVWLTTGDSVYRRSGNAWTHVAALPEMNRDVVHVRSDDDIRVLGTTAEDDSVLAARHWDGQAWRSVPVDTPGEDGAGFTDVLVLSPTDAWAIGYTSPGASGTPLLMHWDGSAWTSTPPPPGLNLLNAITEGPDGTPWIVGHATDTPAAPGLLRHGGAGWERVPTPAVPYRSNINARALAAVPGTGTLWTLGRVDIGGPVVLSDGPRP